jgi:hypothetical protein
MGRCPSPRRPTTRRLACALACATALLAVAAAGCDVLTSPRQRPAAATSERPMLGTAASTGRFERERATLGRYASYFDLVRQPGTVTALVDGEPVRYRAMVAEYVVVPSRNVVWRETAMCGRSARMLVLWREDRDARAAAYVTVLGEDFAASVSVEPLDRCDPVRPRETAFAPHVVLHDLDDADEAWVGYSGEAEIGEGVVDPSPSGCDTTAVWNDVTGTRGSCVPTMHSVSGRVDLVRTGAWWHPPPLEPVPPPGTPPRPTLRSIVDRLLGRRREVRILRATVPGLRFTERCDEQERSHPRNGWVCGGSTF